MAIKLEVSADVRSAISSLLNLGNEIDRAGGVSEEMAKKVAESLNTITSSFSNLNSVKVSNPISDISDDVDKSSQKIADSFSKISNLDFSSKFKDASGKINESINDIANATGNLNSAFSSVKGIDPNVVTNSINSVEGSIGGLKEDVASLKTSFDASVDPDTLNPLKKSFEDLKEKISDKKETEIKVGADVSDAVEGIDKVSEGMTDVQAVIEDAKQKVEAFREALKLATDPNDILILTKGINTLQLGIKQLEKANNPLKNVEAGARQAESTLFHFEGVLREIPQGGLGLESSLAEMVKSFFELRKESGSTGSALKTLAGELLGNGGIALGIGVLIPVVASLVEKFTSSEKSIKESSIALAQFSKDVADAKARVDELGNAISVSNRIGKLNVDVAFGGGLKSQLLDLRAQSISNLDIVDKAEKEGANALNKFIQAKEILISELDKAGDLDLSRAFEQGLLGQFSDKLKGDAKKAYENFTAASELLDKSNEKIGKANNDQKILFAEIRKTKDDIKREFASSISDLNSQLTFDFFGKSFSISPPSEKIIADARKKFEELGKAIPEQVFQKANEENTKRLKDMYEAAKDFATKNANIFNGLTPIISANSQEKGLEAATVFWSNYKKGIISFNIKALKDDIKGKFKDEDIMPVDKLQELPSLVVDQFIRGFQNESERLKDLNIFKNITFSDKDLAAAVDLFKTRAKQFGLEIPKTIEGIGLQGQAIELTFDDLFDTTKISNNEALAALKAAVEKLKARFKGMTVDLANGLQDAINQALQSIQVDGFATIGEAIGAALSGSDIGVVFRNFEQTLGSAVQALGKQIVTLFVTADALKKALKSVFTNPVVGIAAGVALIAVGAAIKSLAGGGIKGFAQGGVVPGQGHGDSVPAMLTPGEYVVTKQQAPLVMEFLRMMGKFKTSALSFNLSNMALPLHFAQGGLVPNLGFNTDKIAPLSRVQFVMAGAASRTPQQQLVSKVSGRDLMFILRQEGQSQNRNFGRGNF